MLGVLGWLLDRALCCSRRLDNLGCVGVWLRSTLATNTMLNVVVTHGRQTPGSSDWMRYTVCFAWRINILVNETHRRIDRLRVQLVLHVSHVSTTLVSPVLRGCIAYVWRGI